MIESFLHSLNEIDLQQYAPVPFWSWNNKIEKDILLEQIQDMKDVGCGGFIIHARTGLKTEYLSEEWFSLVSFCLQRAKELHLNVWIYDDNGWPSGFAGGKLLQDKKNLAAYLVYEKKNFFDTDAYAVFERINGCNIRLWPGEKSSDGVYHTVYVRYSLSTTDILNPDVVDKFIQETHEKYYQRFSTCFGKVLMGFFTDEPQYYRWDTPFSFVCADYWRKEYGEELADGILNLFYNDENTYRFRVRYYKALNHLYTVNFYKKIYDWCEEHGCMLTGHSVDEGALYSQMYGGAGVSSSYEYEHIPGIDNLGKNSGAKLAARQVGTVAGQLGKKQVLTETFGCCGYEVTPKQLISIAEKQYVHGVNFLCHHLYPYSLAGQGKTDYPPCFSKHNVWHEQFSLLNLYLTRLGYLIANSQPLVNCTVLNPMATVYLKYLRNNEKPSMKADIELDNLQKELNRHGILYDITDETILKKYGKVVDKSMEVGLRKYNYVIVPYCETLSVETKTILQEFVRNGGNLFVRQRPTMTDGIKDDWGFLKSNITLREIAASGAIKIETDGRCEYTYRKGKDFEFLFIVNAEKRAGKVTVPQGFCKVDLVELKAYREERQIVLNGGESVFLVRGTAGRKINFGKETVITDRFEFVSNTDNILTVDTVAISLDGKAFNAEEPIAAVFDRLLCSRYCDRLFLKYSFTVQEFGNRLKLRREKGKYISSKLNGKDIVFEKTDFDCLFEEADISDNVCLGKNEFICEIDFYQRPYVYWALFSEDSSENIRNSLSYDSEIENIYMIGDFAVNEKRNICKIVDPKAMDNLQQKGFPFFAGKVKYGAEIYAEKDHARLFVDGDYTVASITVNGKFSKYCFFEQYADLLLEAGKSNRIEIEFSSSLRNMLGPFHCTVSEYCGVTPYHFTMRGKWKNGSCQQYDPKYKLIPFGINKVSIAFEKGV